MANRRYQAHPINNGLIEGKPKKWYLAMGLIGILVVLVLVVLWIPTGPA